jgi:hypothetical protein
MNGVRAGRKAAMPDCIGCRAWRRRGTKSGGGGVQKRERDVRVGRCDMCGCRRAEGDEPATEKNLVHASFRTARPTPTPTPARPLRPRCRV